MARRKRCAVCAQLSRGCPANCPMRQYFPPGDARFRRIQRVFTHEYLQKWMDASPTEQTKTDLVNALSWEAECRLRNPMGSYGEHQLALAQIQALINHRNTLSDLNNALQRRVQVLEAQANTLRQQIINLQAHEAPNAEQINQVPTQIPNQEAVLNPGQPAQANEEPVFHQFFQEPILNQGQPAQANEEPILHQFFQEPVLNLGQPAQANEEPVLHQFFP